MYEYYVDSVQTAANEATMVTESANDLLKRYPKGGYKKAYNQALTGLPKDVGFNTGLSVPQPDFVEGLLVEEFEPFPVRTHISGGELFKDNPNSLSLPHIAGEWRGSGKNMELARLQSSYDGAALVYGRQQALAYLSSGQSDPEGHAMVTTFTTDGNHLNMFAHYAETTPDGHTKYHQFPIQSTNLLESYESFKQGRRGLRNEQDHARAQSLALRDQLREQWGREQQRQDQLRAHYYSGAMPAGEFPPGTTMMDADNADGAEKDGYDDHGEAGEMDTPEKGDKNAGRRSSRNKRKHSLHTPAAAPVRRLSRLAGKNKT